MRAHTMQERAAEREKWRAAVFALWDCSRDAVPDMEPDEYEAWLAVGELLRANASHHEQINASDSEGGELV